MLNEDPDSFSHFCDVINRLHNPKQKMNKKLKEIVEEIDWDTDWFELHYITLAKIGDNIKTRVESGISPCPTVKGIEERADLYLIDEIELNTRLREALSAGDLIEQEVLVRFKTLNELPWLKYESGTGKASYVGLIAGNQLAELYKTYRYKLFAMNIRDYVGDTNTNKTIIKTAIAQPDDFFFFNNGVSAVATSIDPDNQNSEILRCQRFSIINGAQTVRSLAKAHLKNKQSLREATVLLRISEFSLGKDHSFLENVTKFNNTQNSVRVSDFRSNDPIQRELSRAFSDLSRGGKKFLYKNKRSQERNLNRIAVGMEDFAKTIHAFLFGPDDMFGGTSYLFDSAKHRGYCRVFGDGQEPWTQLSDSNFRYLSGIWFLCEEVRSQWKEQKELLVENAENEETKNAVERRWLVFWAVGELLRMIYKIRNEDLEEAVRRLGKPTWLDVDSPVKSAIGDLTNKACEALIKAYGHAASSQEFSHRNWFRSETTLESIRTELRSVPKYAGIKNLPRLEVRAASANA